MTTTIPHWRRREETTAWLMSLPALICLLLFVALPLIMAAYLSLTDKRLISPLPTEFVGLRNYTSLLSVTFIEMTPEVDPSTGQAQRDENGQIVYPRLRTIIRGNPAYEGYQEWIYFDLSGHHYAVVAKDPTFLQALLNTFVFACAIVPIQGGLALFMALMVNQKLRGITFFRTVYFTPVVTSIAVLSVVWVFLYNPEQGLVNRVLSELSFGSLKNIPWLISPKTSLLAIIIVSAWQGAGFQMIIFLAGLQSIPEELYEAAQIDGAGNVQRFLFITLPQLRNTLVFVVIGTTILAFRLFTQVDVMTKGGPNNSSETVVHDAIEQGFRQQQIGYASAITLIFFVIVLVIALTQRALLRSEQEIE